MSMASETDSTGLSVRPADDGDLEPLASALEPEVPVARLARRLEESRLGYRGMLVAELDRRVVGTVSMGGHGFQRPGSLRLFALDVGAAFRRRGAGTALVEAVEAIASGRGLDEVNLEVAIDNEHAIRLYERLGYRRHGEPVMDRWEKRLDDGSSLLVEVPSWVMVKRLERVQAAIAAPTGRPARSLPRRHGQTTAAARPSSQPERGTSLRAVEASTLRRGVSKGQHDSVFRWDRHQH